MGLVTIRLPLKVSQGLREKYKSFSNEIVSAGLRKQKENVQGRCLNVIPLFMFVDKLQSELYFHASFYIKLDKGPPGHE